MAKKPPPAARPKQWRRSQASRNTVSHEKTSPSLHQAGARMQRRHPAPGADLGAALVPACRAGASSCTRRTSTPCGAHRGGIDERWFASTTPAANEGAPPDEGLSYVVHDGKKAFTLARRHRAAKARR